MYVQKLSEALVSRGHEVTILTTDAISRIPLRRVASGRQQCGRLSVVRFPCYGFLYSYLPVSPRLTIALLGNAIVGYDIVHAHGYGHFTSDIVAMSGRLFGKPTVLTTHGVHQEIHQEGIDRQLLWFYYRGSLVKSTISSVDRILVLTDDEIPYLLRNAPEAVNKTIVIPIGVSLEEFSSVRDTRELESARPTIVYVGRIAKGKGLEVLIESISRLKRYDPQLLIVGARTNFSATLEAQAANRSIAGKVVLPGFLNEESKRRLLMEATVFCLPSMYEGASLAILEAMAAGKPVIATRTGGIPHLVEDKSSGYLVKYGDAAALSDRLEKLILDSSLRHSMGKRGRAIAEKHSWSQVAQEVEQAYLQLK